MNIGNARERFHADLFASVLTLSDSNVASNADKDSRLSRSIALAIIEQLGTARRIAKPAGQTAGKDFETICAVFIETAFLGLSHLRGGRFSIRKGGGIASFDQYEHLAALDLIARHNRDIATALGTDYLIKPDIVIASHPVGDDHINAASTVIDSATARLTPFRAANAARPTLHASISCKWTLRSDRAQNARSEGLNLIRNRKGRLPHIAVITGEPMPSRIASLALGTGDIDCVYHIALPELQLAVEQHGNEDSREGLAAMVEGRRLRDIADLPFDLLL